MESSLTGDFSALAMQALCGVSPRQLAYWDKLGLLVPRRVPRPTGGSPLRLYSFTQALEARVMARLRKDVSLQSIRRAINVLENMAETNRLSDKSIVVIRGKLALVRTETVEKRYAIWLTGNHERQLAMPELLISPTHEATAIISEWRKQPNIAPGLKEFERQLKLAA